eukprot:COSAG06_NODE_25345_length_639_cov_1.014815_2_plen_89_part_00
MAATTLFSGLTGGLTSTCGRAITADCVPVDPVTLVPIAPARDFMVASYASIIPSLIILVRTVHTQYRAVHVWRAYCDNRQNDRLLTLH